MELRCHLLCLAVFVLAVVPQYSDAHAMHRRETDDDINYDDPQADEANDDYTQNDTGDSPPAQQKEPAKILTQPVTYRVNVTNNVRLECKVEPDTAVVQWLKDNKVYFIGNAKIKTQEVRLSIVPDSKDLLIKDVTPADRGVYRCEILQATPVSISHTLEVLEAPKILEHSATNGGRVVEGSDLLLTCHVTGTPTPQILWSRTGANGMNERLQEKDGEFSGNSLFIRDVKREFAGQYYCYAFNSLGSNQVVIDVTVVGKPRVHVHRAKVNSDYKIEAILECTTYEEPNPQIRWYIDGHLIDSNDQYNITTVGIHSNLSVLPTGVHDFGIFTCEAENEHGKHNKSIEVTQSPIVDDVSVDGPKVSWTIHSHQPLMEIDLQVKDVESNSADWRRFPVEVPKIKSHKYKLIHSFENELQNGKYLVMVKVRNSISWGRAEDPVLVEIKDSLQYIQHASVFGQPGKAHSTEISTALVISYAMYLLVRML